MLTALALMLTTPVAPETAAAPIVTSSTRWDDLDPAARAALLPAVAEQLNSAIAVDRDRALFWLIRAIGNGQAEAQAPLLDWVRHHVTSDEQATRRLAYNGLAALLTVGNSGGQQLLAAEIARTGGIMESAPLTLTDGNLATFVTPDDYPSTAHREKVGGNVEAMVLISPEGRVLTVDITSSTDARLNRTVETTARRRIRLPASITNGHFVRAALPPVHFRVLSDDDPRAPAEPPAGAVIVTASPAARGNVDMVIY